MAATPAIHPTLVPLQKTPTGIAGLDAITGGGLPEGRVTLVCGDPGCGKTLLGIEFLVRGATEYGEPGVFLAFEETPDDLAKNVASLGFDLERLVAEKKLAMDYIHIDRDEIEDAGEYDLEGLFVRLDYAIRSVGAKRVVLDTIEALFGGLTNHSILRSELRRLFRWLKDRGVTAVVTGERGEKTLTRQGLEEYVSDCVILMDHRVSDQAATRRLRVVKYRGSVHSSNEFPFLIDQDGISVLPVTSVGLDHRVSEERVSTGNPELDRMLGGEGFYRGSSILISGSAGSGKSTLAATMVDAACSRGERVLYFSMEESPGQIVRNMRSVGIDLQHWIDAGQLRFHASRPTAAGLEMHLTMMHKLVDAFEPQMVVLDPVSSFMERSAEGSVRSMLMRMVDFLKVGQVTAVYTSLTTDVQAAEHTDLGVSSLMDSWILLRNLESHGERNRGLYVLKSRGMGHSNQIREFQITSEGVSLRDPYVGPGGVFTGSARLAQEARDRAAIEEVRRTLRQREVDLERKRKLMEAEVAALRASFEAEEEQVRRVIEDEIRLERDSAENAQHMVAARQGPARG